MSPTPVFYLLPPERVEHGSDARYWLGRIVQNHAAPDASFTPTNPHTLLSTHPVSESHISKSNAFVQSSSRRELSTRLTGLAHAFSASRAGANLRFETSSIRYLRLQNHAKALDALREDQEVRRDLARMLSPGGEPAYMIVGMLIWEDAAFVQRRGESNGVAGLVEVPVGAAASAAVAATTGAVIPVEAGNPGFGAGREEASRRELSGFSEGSGIFAFEYRTIRRKVYSLGRNFTPRLGGYGGRIERDAVFSHDGNEKGGKQEDAESAGFVAMDDEDCSWMDYIDETPIVEELDGVRIAFDPVDAK